MTPLNSYIYDYDRERQLIHECLERIRDKIISNIDSHGLKASGRTQASLVIEDGVDSGVLKGRPYFQSLEVGRPAGPVPSNFREIIGQWIVDKGINIRLIPYKTDRPHKYTVEERSFNMAVGAICHTIAERGTKLYREGGDETVYSTVIGPSVEELKKDLQVEIINIIKNNLN